MANLQKKFIKTIQELAEANEWEIEEMDDGSVAIEFEAESGNDQTLCIMLQDETVEFDIPSAACFESEDDIPGDASTTLLKRNAKLVLGAWVLEEIDDKWYYSLMYNVSLEDLEAMDSDVFADNVSVLIEECDQFDTLWEESDWE